MIDIDRIRQRSVAAVILAAGAGSRYAGDTHKLFAEIDGRPVISHVVDAARASEVDEVIVVGGAVDLDSFVPDDVTLIHNEQWADGQATSLRAAVGYAESRRHDALVVGLGDSPGVTTEIWNKVAEVDADLASARYGGELRPPVRLSASMWASLPVSGDDGARALMRQRPDLVRPVPVEGDPRDIDTLEDLRRWS
ncbi:MAG: nucleotidyltransferase family protein [Actinomycetota bacterium]|nr:nucleotidyltransferase family protein [Actinomycetota bacterium]